MLEHLITYQNGDVSVSMYSDGTKVRQTNHDDWVTANRTLVHPESIDMKITNYCDLGCKYCHEESTKSGNHAKFEDIVRATEGLPAGVELAIGGGNPLDHPQLTDILQHLCDKGLFPNLTINVKHLRQPKYWSQLVKLKRKGIVYGVGVSYRDLSDLLWLKHVSASIPNVIVHMIAGVNSYKEIKAAVDMNLKVLILGYKRYGLGKQFISQTVVDNVIELKRNLFTLLGKTHISFDNKAVAQLEVEKHLKPELWLDTFMGVDGSVTMYYDASTDTFAKNSTSDRVTGTTIVDFFKTLKD